MRVSPALACRPVHISTLGPPAAMLIQSQWAFGPHSDRLPRASAARLRTRSYRGALAGFDITGTQTSSYGKLRRRGAEIARSEVASEGTADGSVRLPQS